MKRLLFLIVLLSALAWGQSSSGPNFPTAATGNTGTIGSGTLAWGTPANIEANDSNFATNGNTTHGVTQTTDDLIGTGFGFAIPSNAVVLGIFLEVNLLGSVSAGGTLVESNIQLLKAGAAAGNNKSAGANRAISQQTVSYGGSSDLWGTTWTPADINNANFGATNAYSFFVVGVSDIALIEVNFYRITITFTLGSSQMLKMFSQTRSLPTVQGTLLRIHPRKFRYQCGNGYVHIRDAKYERWIGYPRSSTNRHCTKSIWRSQVYNKYLLPLHRVGDLAGALATKTWKT